MGEPQLWQLVLILLNVLLGVVTSVALTSVRRSHDRNTALAKEIADFKLKVAEQYVSNRQLDAVVVRMEQRFDRIEALLYKRDQESNQ